MNKFDELVYDYLLSQNKEDAEAYKATCNEYDRLASQTKIVERVRYLTPCRFIEQMKEAMSVTKGYYKNKAGQYMHMCGIEVYGNTSDLGRMGYNGEDRGVFPHWVFVDKHQIQRIESPVIGFTKYFSSLTDEEHRMFPTTKEDFEQAVQTAVHNFMTPWQDPDGIKEDEFLKWMEDWVDFQHKQADIVKKYELDNCTVIGCHSIPHIAKPAENT